MLQLHRSERADALVDALGDVLSNALPAVGQFAGFSCRTSSLRLSEALLSGVLVIRLAPYSSVDLVAYRSMRPAGTSDSFDVGRRGMVRDGRSRTPLLIPDCPEVNQLVTGDLRPALRGLIAYFPSTVEHLRPCLPGGVV